MSTRRCSLEMQLTWMIRAQSDIGIDGASGGPGLVRRCPNQPSGRRPHSFCNRYRRTACMTIVACRPSLQGVAADDSCDVFLNLASYICASRDAYTKPRTRPEMIMVHQTLDLESWLSACLPELARSSRAAGAEDSERRENWSSRHGLQGTFQPGGVTRPGLQAQCSAGAAAARPACRASGLEQGASAARARHAGGT